MSMLLGHELGTERIAREALEILLDNLNTAIDYEDAKWATLDSELASKLGINYIECKSDHVDTENFHMGHRPSLIEAPVEGYPNICVMSYNASRSGDQGDQYDGNRLSMYVEAMAIDGPYESMTTGFNRDGEDMVNRKVQRLGEAIHNVLISNRTLNGLIYDLEFAAVHFSNCERRRAQAGSGDEYYWQMLRLEYNINKISAY